VQPRSVGGARNSFHARSTIERGGIATNGLQISEGTNSLGFVQGNLGFCLCAVMRSPYIYVLIFNKLENILKINKKYFENSLQLSK
jgi:hypothetical protein